MRQQIREKNSQVLILCFLSGVFAFCGSGQTASSQPGNGGTLTGKVLFYIHGRPLPPPIAGTTLIRLCSPDRVLQAEPDRQGAFHFSDVPGGEYDLVANSTGWPPRIARRVEIRPGQTQFAKIIRDIDQNLSLRPEDSFCFRDNSFACEPTSFIVNYGPLVPGASARIIGKVTDVNSRHQAKGLKKAHIELFKHGERTALYVISSDKHGEFQMTPPPGVYDLTMSLPRISTGQNPVISGSA